jgi:alpha-L-fucosidase 2
MAGAWLSLHLWEHYAFHRDRAFLARAYPTLHEASLFFLDFLQQDSQGRLVVVPTSSPENVYRLPDGKVGTLCAGCSMDSQILDALFASTATAARLLGRDEEFAGELDVARSRLPQPQVGARGNLMEWLEDCEDVEPNHRHLSHLFALHPGNSIAPSTTPALAEACRVTLEHRGDPSTGWSLAWKIGCWARLGDGDRAERLLRLLLDPVEATTISCNTEGGSYPNLFCAHPPFQIDGNFGGTAAIAEMLLQSHLVARSADGESVPVVHILPALPASWPEGNVRGLRVRGNLRASFSWSGGRLEKLSLTALGEAKVSLRHGELTREVSFKANERRHFDSLLKDA